MTSDPNSKEARVRLEDEPAILLYVDILGFKEITKRYRVRVQEHSPYYATTEIQRQINCFNRILDSNISEISITGGTQAMLFSDCAFLVFSKNVPNDYPAVRAGLVATDLMRKFVNNLVPVRMGIGKGTFYDMEYLTTTNGKLIISKSRFIGTAVVHAREAEDCDGKGLRIFIHESAEEELPNLGRHLELPKPEKSVNWELNYLHVGPIRKKKQVESDDRQLFDNVSKMNAPGLEPGAQRQYTDTLAALNRMRIKNGHKAFQL